MGTALLVIDVQRELTDALEPARRSELLTTLRGLIDRARTAGAPVVYVRHQDDVLVPGEPLWQITEDVAPRAADPIVEKRYRDAFRETDLADVLSGAGIDHVVVCGMQTEFCVDATIREAERRGFRVTLVADGHATYPSGTETEQQIRAQVHRVASGEVAEIIPAHEVFAP